MMMITQNNTQIDIFYSIANFRLVFVKLCLYEPLQLSCAAKRHAHVQFSHKSSLLKKKAGTVAEWVRASALSHSEWMVPGSSPASGWHIKYTQYLFVS